MNSSEAKFILEAYRPGGGDACDPEMAKALEVAGTDSELAQWFEASHAFDEQVADSLRSIPIPDDLRENILAGRRVTVSSGRGPRWQPFAWAAALVVVFGIVAFWVVNPAAHEFAEYRKFMIEAAATNVGPLDLYSNDPAELREFLEKNSAHADFLNPTALETLDPIGCRVLEWNDRKVSLICFGDAHGRMFHLFVIDRDAFDSSMVADAAKPEVTNRGAWSAVSWVSRSKAYLLAGNTDLASLQKLL